MKQIGMVSFSYGTFMLKELTDQNDDIVIWDDGLHEHYSLEIIDPWELEVLGNVFDNPELLSVERN